MLLDVRAQPTKNNKKMIQQTSNFNQTETNQDIKPMKQKHNNQHFKMHRICMDIVLITLYNIISYISDYILYIYYLFKLKANTF